MAGVSFVGDRADVGLEVEGRECGLVTLEGLRFFFATASDVGGFGVFAKWSRPDARLEVGCQPPFFLPRHEAEV